jgi:hypothetical protein
VGKGAAYLEKYGPKALKNGYEIIPIKPGTKRPPFDKWEEIRATQSKLDRWLEHGRADHGVGILARRTPLVDIDCRDPAIVKKMVRFTQKLLGETLQRIGFAPKTGLLYRTDKPFPKVNSATFIDPDAEPGEDGKPVTHKLEVLGDGQQFVAFAVHPDTGQPYRWIDKEAPHNFAWEDLPEITREDALKIAAEFERLMREAGYIEKRKARLDRQGANDIDEDDEFATDVHPIDMTTQELSLRLALVPGADDYDTWRDVGMALWHQYAGSDEGLILWHEWSAQASNYDQDVLDEKWPTFNIEGKGRQPITARFILKLAGEEEKRVAGEQAEDTREEIRKAKTVESLKDAAEKVKRIPFEPLIREGIVDLVKKRYREISGSPLSTSMARQLTRYENPENKRKPKWLEGYVYIESDKVFYHTVNRMELDAEAFNAKHNRFMMTQKDRLEGRSAPEHTASQAALNLWEIETVYRRMYMPHEDQFFTYNGQRFVNFYTEIGVPDVPESLDSDEKRAIKRVKAHFEHLFANERDRKLLLDWLAYIVQERRRISWAPLIQGTQGDGKTFFARMLMAVLGWENVAIVPGEALEEKYNHWMEGALLVFFEEVRLHGQDRYAAINRMKPWITNENITIRAMHRGSYGIVNTASIIAASNHKDAIPAGNQDTRYFPMFSRWQTKERLEAFERENPNYYVDLYGTLDHAAALRFWLLNHELSDEFNAQARAPRSANRAEMLSLSASDEEEAFEEALNESEKRDFSKVILDSAKLDDELENRSCDAPQGKARKRFLSEHGFSPLPKKVKHEGKAKRLWTQRPDLFIDEDGEQDNAAIIAWLDKGRMPE